MPIIVMAGRVVLSGDIFDGADHNSHPPLLYTRGSLTREGLWNHGTSALRHDEENGPGISRSLAGHGVGHRSQ